MPARGMMYNVILSDASMATIFEVLMVKLDSFAFAVAPKPSPGPHKQRECLPLILVLRNRLKWVLQGCRAAGAMLQLLFLPIECMGSVSTAL